MKGKKLNQREAREHLLKGGKIQVCDVYRDKEYIQEAGFFIENNMEYYEYLEPKEMNEIKFTGFTDNESTSIWLKKLKEGLFLYMYENERSISTCLYYSQIPKLIEFLKGCVDEK